MKEKRVETNRVLDWENIPKNIADVFLSVLEKIIFEQLLERRNNEV